MFDGFRSTSTSAAMVVVVVVGRHIMWFFFSDACWPGPQWVIRIYSVGVLDWVAKDINQHSIDRQHNIDTGR